MRIDVAAPSELGEVNIAGVRIPVKVTMGSLAWLQQHEYIAGPSLPDVAAFAKKAITESGTVAFLAPVLAAIAATAEIDVSREAIAAALKHCDALTTAKLNVLVQAAIRVSYLGPYPVGKGNAVPVAAPDGSARRGTGAKRSSRRRNAG